MQAPKASSSLATSTAQSTSERASKRADGKLKSGYLTGAAALASAGAVLPLVAEGAIANPNTNSRNVAEQSVTGNQRSQAGALNQSKGVLPQIPQAERAEFSPGTRQGTRQNNRQRAAARVLKTSNDDLIRQDADGHWTLAYATGSNQSTQAVVSQLATETSQAAATRTCIGNDCQRLAYINQQLPQAQQTLQQKQQALETFAQERTQSSLPAYKKVLSDRIGEISQQKTELTNDIAETRGYIGQLRIRLSTVDVDLDLPAALLASDVEYQFAWAELERTEENLLKEYSQVNIDATALNSVYAQYRQQQQRLEQAATNALSTYLLDENTQAPPIMYEAPAALDVLQALVVATHQERVQLLRNGTIGSLEGRLRDRQQVLARDISTHERLQRELNTAQSIVDQYIKDRDTILANASAVQLASQGAPEPIAAETIEQASFLQTQLPEGSVGRALMGIVVAVGGIATVAHKRKQRPAQRLTTAQRPSIPVFEGQKTGATLADSQPSRPVKEGSLVNELQDLMSTSAPIVPKLTPADVDGSIAIMARELDTLLNSSQTLVLEPEKRFARTVTMQAVEPVRVSLNEIDLFAEKAIQWVLKDLHSGLVTPAEAKRPSNSTASKPYAAANRTEKPRRYRAMPHLRSA